jgi:hypothetical protein
MIREQIEMFVIITFILNNQLMAVQECISFSYFMMLTWEILLYNMNQQSAPLLNLI